MTLSKLNDSQRKIYNTVRNGWFVGGNYSAKFDNHEKMFFADSPQWLYRDVNDWFASHAERHADASLLVKFQA